MKDLIRALILGIALSVFAGAAVVKADVQVPCDQPYCSVNKSIEPGGNTTWQANCNAPNTTVSDFICHKGKGISCAKPTSPHWKCQCQNWAAYTESSTLDIWCKPRS